MSRFYVRTVRAGDGSVEDGSFEIEPEHEQGRRIVGVMREYLKYRPPQFRDRVEFLNRGDFELEWMAADGGVAIARLVEGGAPLLDLVLLSGIDPESEAGLLEAAPQGRAAIPERPLMLGLMSEGKPEWTPAALLLATALGAVYFGAIASARSR